MAIDNNMNLTFKSAFQKTWTLLSDRLIYDGKEILFTEIKDVKIMGKVTIATNGIIQLIVGNKPINLVYTKKNQNAGEIAIEYLCKNYGNKEDRESRKTLSEVQTEIDNLPFKDNLKSLKDEIKELPFILLGDENIKAMTSGLTNGSPWLMVCTNKRVLHIDKKRNRELQTTDIPLDRINSISYSKKGIFGKISITDGSTTREIENVSLITMNSFIDTVNKEKELNKEAKMNPTTQVINNVSTADELMKYKQLMDMGVLTPEEFEVKKKELLGL